MEDEMICEEQPEIVEELQEFYNKHYITVDERGRVVDGWSDGAHPDQDSSEAVCINEQGGYQFRLAPDGEENPTLYDWDGMIPLYRWDGAEVVQRTAEEIEADRAAAPTLSPAEQREEAYNTSRIIPWDGGSITVTEAAQLWQYYAAEGNPKAEQLQALIAAAKAEIRAQYPDEEVAEDD